MVFFRLSRSSACRGSGVGGYISRIRNGRDGDVGQKLVRNYRENNLSKVLRMITFCYQGIFAIIPAGMTRGVLLSCAFLGTGHVACSIPGKLWKYIPDLRTRYTFFSCRNAVMIAEVHTQGGAPKQHFGVLSICALRAVKVYGTCNCFICVCDAYICTSKYLHTINTFQVS